MRLNHGQKAAIVAAITIFVAWLVIGGLVRGAFGHMAQPVEGSPAWFYSDGCCGGQDCRRAWPDEVQFVEGGYVVTTSKQFFAFDAEEVKESQDGYFHVCQYRAADYAETLVTRCLYVPNGMI